MERHLAAGQRAKALRLLDEIIENAMPLFGQDPQIQGERRTAWLHRITLLREWGRLSEALAWTCLECELNPSNVAAQAIKHQLKVRLNLGSGRASDSTSSHEPRRDNGGLWKGVAGLRELKAIIEEDIILPLQERDLYARYRVGLPNGVLLYGPPGCGKTFIARKLAERLGFTFVEVKPSDLASIYVHGGQEKIGKLFADARSRAPTMIFFDELDALIPERGQAGHHYSAEVNEFLVQINECAKANLLVIGATNYLRKVDPAVRRPGRLDKQIFVGPPDIEARVELLKSYMEGRPQEGIAWLQAAEACEIYTSAEIELVVNEAAKLALRDRRLIRTSDLLTAIEKVPPALSADATQPSKWGG